MLCIPVSDLVDFPAHAHMLEFRLDRFSDLSFAHVKALREKVTLPVIFTPRKKMSHYREWLLCKPDYLDLEYDTPSEVIEEIRVRFPDVKIIVSYHNFSETPDSLEEILQEMKKCPADLYKLSCFANSTLDSLRMLTLMQKYPGILGMCMGEKGVLTRILGKVFGAPWIYASQEGVITAEELTSVYEIEGHSSSTALYGLIGKVVSQSLSHLTHNKMMREHGIDGVYVKMPLEQEELPAFFKYAKILRFKGISITMPYKENVRAFVDESASPHALNTLTWKEGRVIGTNTDGVGALDAIEERESVLGKKIVILGAGGAAKAIAYEAVRRGSEVCILNRSENKLEGLCVKYGRLDETWEGDVLINTTPTDLSLECMHTDTLVMDIRTVPKMTLFLKSAQKKGCKLVFGYEMFVLQALGQFKSWFPNVEFDKVSFKKIVESYLQE